MPWSIWLVTDCVFEIFFDSQPLALEHVLEVHVAAEVELVRAVDRDAAVLEEAGEHAVRDGGADLALDVVADDRDAGVGELLRPLGVAGDEHRDRVHERRRRRRGRPARSSAARPRSRPGGRTRARRPWRRAAPARRRPARPATPRRSRGSTCRGRRTSGPRCTCTPSSADVGELDRVVLRRRRSPCRGRGRPCRRRRRTRRRTRRRRRGSRRARRASARARRSAGSALR